MNSCIQSHLSTIPKLMTKEIQTWMFPFFRRVWGCSHSSPKSPSLKPWEICLSKSSKRLALQFSKYVVILVGNKHYIQGNLEMGCRVWDRPEPKGSMFFIFTFDSNGTTADIFFCRVNKFCQCCFKGHSLKNILWHRQSISLSCWFQCDCHPQRCSAVGLLGEEE